jgi:hypothetical protein
MTAIMGIHIFNSNSMKLLITNLQAKLIIIHAPSHLPLSLLVVVAVRIFLLFVVAVVVVVVVVVVCVCCWLFWRYILVSVVVISTAPCTKFYSKTITGIL